MVIVGYLIVRSIVPFSKEFLVGVDPIVPIEIPLWGPLFYCCKDPTTYHKHIHSHPFKTIDVMGRKLQI